MEIEARPNDWLLSFNLEKQSVTRVEWTFLDFIVKIAPKEERYYYRARPYHAVQVHKPSYYPAPPFKITPAFRSAFRQAIRRYSAARIMEAKTYKPSKRLLKYIAEAMRPE